MRVLLVVLAAASVLSAAVDGVVTNRTAGKPQAGVSVTLMKLSGGMEPVGSVKTDAEGRFAFAQTLEPGPHMLQALHDGVTYNKLLQPGTPTTGLALDVFDASATPGGAKVLQHMILLEPSESELAISESIVFQNDGTTTYNDPKNGTLRFYLPPAAKGQVAVSVAGPQAMPLQRAAERTTEKDVYAVKFPVRPGETRFDLTYRMPAVAQFEHKVLHGGGPVRIVAPQGVKLAGPALADLGQEPRTQATIYEVKAASYKIDIQGTGSLRAAAEAAGAGGEDSAPEIEQKKPRVYERLGWVLGLSLLILALGFVLLYRKTAPAGGTRA